MVYIDKDGGANLSNLVEKVSSERMKSSAFDRLPKTEGWLAGGFFSGVDFRLATKNISSHFEKCQSITSRIKEFAPNINSFWNEHADTFEKIQSVAQGLNQTIAFVDCCKKTEWPIYWDSSKEFEEEIADIAAWSEDESQLKASVTEAVLSYYANSKLDEIGDRWSKSSLVNAGQLTMMKDALNKHEAGDYLASTTLLMCLFDGLVTKFCTTALESGLLSDEDFDFVLEHHNLRKRSNMKLPARAKVTSLVFCTSGGVLHWDASSEYITNTILTGRDDWEGLAAANPLRNKICHGLQTNHGTIVHSLKAILASDLILRLGVIVEAALLEESE